MECFDGVSPMSFAVSSSGSHPFPARAESFTAGGGLFYHSPLRTQIISLLVGILLFASVGRSPLSRGWEPRLN